MTSPADDNSSGDSLEDDLIFLKKSLLQQGMPADAADRVCQELREEVETMARKQSTPPPLASPSPPPPEDHS